MSQSSSFPCVSGLSIRSCGPVGLLPSLSVCSGAHPAVCGLCFSVCVCICACQGWCRCVYLPVNVGPVHTLYPFTCLCAYPCVIVPLCL